MTAEVKPATSRRIGTILLGGGASGPAIEAWLSAEPHGVSDFAAARRACERFWGLSRDLVASLPAKPGRSAGQTQAVEAVVERARSARDAFLNAHVDAVYAELTDKLSRFVRVEDLVLAAADAFPGLTPSRADLNREVGVLQRDKDALEIDQGIFLAHVLGHEQSGRHLCHAMLRPLPESAELLDRFLAEGILDVGAARLERCGPAVRLTAANPRYLNAEDATTLRAMEAAVDVAILDPESKVVVLRGGEVDHPKYRGRRLFGSGINLTHLYRGDIPFTWFVQRDLGYVHKIFRGVSLGDAVIDDVHSDTAEKQWIGAVEGFAIGGHCQLLLVMDYTIAASDAYMTLPAQKEGIIPGAANLRLARQVGEKLARQLVQYQRRLDSDTPEGRRICDEIVAPDAMDAAIETVVANLTTSGAVGALANRRAFRVGAEPLDIFRRYMAVYAREQAGCHFSPALIANLERYWDAQNRQG